MITNKFLFINFKSISDRIGLIQLSNIVKKNALNLKMLDEIHSLVKDIDNTNHQIIILESLCPNVFSSGHDLEEFYKNFPLSLSEENKKIIDTCNKTMLSINKSNKIFISEISSQLVTAAGFQLASTCDLIVSSSDSIFSIPGSTIGLYAATPAIPLVNSLPRKLLLDLLITGRKFSAIEMLKHGLINEHVEVSKDDSKEDIRAKIRCRSLELSNNIFENGIENIKEFKKYFYKL